MKKLAVSLVFLSLCAVLLLPIYADDFSTKTINYENDYYTLIYNNKLQTLEYSLKGFYTYIPKTLAGNEVSKYWAAAGPNGLVIVYKVEPNSFPYLLINHKTGKVESSGYLYVDKYDVKDAKLIPTKKGAKATVYYVTGGEKSFDLMFNDETLKL